MTVFDLAKNLFPQAMPLDYLLCGNRIFQGLRDEAALSESDDKSPFEFCGFRIQCVEDPAERKLQAFTINAITGSPVLFEDDQGNILEVSMPKPAFSPFHFIPRKQT